MDDRIDLAPVVDGGGLGEGLPACDTSCSAIEAVSVGGSDGDHVGMEILGQVIRVSLGPGIVEGAQGGPDGLPSGVVEGWHGGGSCGGGGQLFVGPCSLLAKWGGSGRMDNYRVKTAMSAIALLVESGATPSSVTATLDLFRIAARVDPADALRVDVFSAHGGTIALTEALSLDTLPLPPRLEGYAAVIMPGFFAQTVDELVEGIDAAWRPAIARLRTLDPATLVAASCYGTFVLAESGRLDGRAATTSWWFQEPFAARYPKVRLDAGQALVDDGNVLTAGAMTAHTDLSLHILRRLKGHALARGVASIMLVDEAKSSQRPFMALPRTFADPLVDAAIDWMEQRLAVTFSAAELSAALHVSYRTLHRRFRALAGMAPLAYLHALRVERAKALLEQTRQSIEQIAAAVGYADISSFRRVFARHTALTPAQYRRQFRRMGGS